MTKHRQHPALTLGTVWLGIAICNCGDTLSVERDPRSQTTGAVLFEIACERVLDAELPGEAGRQNLCEDPSSEGVQLPPSLSTLLAHRDELIDAIDRIFPSSDTESLRDLVGRVAELALPPERPLAVLTDRLAEHAMSVSNRPDSLQALSRSSHRIGYRTRNEAFGVLNPLFGAPDLVPTVAEFVRGLDSNPSLQSRWSVFLDVVALELDRLKWSGEPIDPLSVTEWLLGETEAEADESLWIVVRGSRGLAVPQADSDDTLPPPWVDANGDGQADADSLSRFVDEENVPIEAPNPFPTPADSSSRRDRDGRALSDDDELQYVYRDSLSAAAAALLEELAPVTSALLGSVSGWLALSGPVQPASIAYGDSSYPIDQRRIEDGALSDLVYATSSIVAQPAAIDGLGAIEALISSHDETLAALVDLVVFIDGEVDSRDGLGLEQPSNFVDDILRVGGWIAGEEGLTEALLRAFADPRSLRLGPIYAGLMRFRDEVRLDPAMLNRVRSGVVLDEPVDREQPNSSANQSVFQRSAALIHDLDGARLCNKQDAFLTVTLGETPIRWPLFRNYDECELFAIDNLAELYARSVLGIAQIELLDEGLVGLLALLEGFGVTSIDELLETESGIDGLTTRPTPEALNRLVFSEPNAFLSDLIEPVSTRDGLAVGEVHPQTSVAWEALYRFDDGREPTVATFYDAMTPLLDAFERFDRREQGRYLFGETISALHLHWSAPDQGELPTTQSDDPDAPLYAEQSGAVRYESVVAESFDDGELFVRLHKLIVDLESITVGEGDGVAALAGWIETLLDPDRHPDLVNRSGDPSVTSADGSRTIAWTPLYLLIDAFDRIESDFAAGDDDTIDTEWRDAIQTLASHIFETGPEPNQGFQRRSTVRLLRSAVGWVGDIVRSQEREGELSAWGASLTPRFQRFWRRPLISASLELLGQLADHPEAEAALLRLIDMALERPASLGTAALVSLLDILELQNDEATLRPLLDELSRLIATDVAGFLADGASVDSQNGTVELLLDLIDRLEAVDPDRAIGGVLARALALPADPLERAPIEVVADVYSQVNRVEPGSAAPLTPDDWRLILGSTAELLTDSERGLERFYRVLDSRSLSP